MLPRAASLVTAAIAAALILCLALPGVALAHERRTIAGGKYEVVVGWDVEPAFEGQKNAASIRILRAGTTDPVQGAEQTLKLAIRQGGTTREFKLRTVFNQPGYYVADVVPTRHGEYQFIFTGSIGGDAVNETFDTADKKFNPVEPLAPLQFPLSLGDPSEAAAQIAAVQAEAQGARTLAYAGIAAGVLGLIAAVAALASRPRAAAGAPARRAAERT